MKTLGEEAGILRDASRFSVASTSLIENVPIAVRAFLQLKVFRGFSD